MQHTMQHHARDILCMQCGGGGEVFSTNFVKKHRKELENETLAQGALERSHRIKMGCQELLTLLDHP